MGVPSWATIDTSATGQAFVDGGLAVAMEARLHSAIIDESESFISVGCIGSYESYERYESYRSCAKGGD
jgi:hypothetical protein